MSFSEQELYQHCKTILQSPRINHKIVILCEGNLQILKQHPSPSVYRQLEKYPDANFYKKCIPAWWKQARPEFFICGDKENVINTYFALQQIHQQEMKDSYLNPQKLFAIIDLDLQPPRVLENYFVADTHELFNYWYQKNKLQVDNITHSSIFITGLIYKEAYFLIPDLQTLFDNYKTPIYYQENPIQLENLYLIMLNALTDDANLEKHFKYAKNRLSYINGLDFSNIHTLQKSWLHCFKTANETEKQQLIYALLSIHQVKNYWKSFKAKECAFFSERFEEELTLMMGQFYAQQPHNSEHHIPSFFKALTATAF